LGTPDTVGNAFTAPFTATLRLDAPAEASDTLPAIFPAGADAADRTYTTVLLTVPPDCVSDTLAAYPLPGERDTWKFAGAVAVMFPVRPLPDTVNCCRLGFDDEAPMHAEMLPVTVPAVITGAGLNLALPLAETCQTDKIVIKQSRILVFITGCFWLTRLLTEAVNADIFLS
jgi:hypothetical protein